MIALAVGGGAIALASRFAFAIGGPDNNPSAVLVLIAAALTAVAPASRVPTMLTIIVLSTIVTGVALYALGRAHAARIIRFVPLPMVGGFNAASGVLVALGAFRVLTGNGLSIASIHSAIGAGLVPQLLAALGFAALVLLVSSRFGPMSVSLAFVGAVALAAPVRLLASAPTAAWFFHMPRSTPWLPLSAFAAPVDWHAIVLAAPQFLVIAAVTVATLLLNSSGLELLASSDVNLDHELRVTGVANVLTGLLGGMVAFTSFSRSSISYQLGERGRFTGMVTALCAAALIVVGPWRVIDVVPVFAPAGLLIALGGGIAYRWLIQGRRRESRGDYVTILIIVGVTVALGFIPGIVAGLASGCIVFVVRYGRVDAVRQRVSGRVRRSSIQRSSRENDALNTWGDRIHIFALRGYIFFGTADRLYRELLDTVKDAEGMTWIVVDFASVTGIDSSASGAFVKFARTIDAGHVRFAVAGMTRDVAVRWNASLDTELHALAFEDLDLALEYCERDLLGLYESYSDAPEPIERWLAQEFGKELGSMLFDAMERVELDIGNVLCFRGEPSDRMFFVESGRFAIVIGDEHPRRVGSAGPHTIIGEMGLYRHAPRSATVVAEIPSVAYALTRDALDVIEAHDPIAGLAFHACVVRALAERLERQNELLAADDRG